MSKIRINTEEWLPWEWPGFHWYQGYAPMLAWQQDLKKMGLPISKMATTYSKGVTGWYFVKSEYERLGRVLFNRIKSNPEVMFGILNRVDKAADAIFRLDKWKKINFHELSDSELLKYHRKLFTLDSNLWRPGQPQNLLELHNNYLSEYVRQVIIKHFGKEKLVEVFSILTTPRYITITERQEREFVRLSNQLLKLSPKSREYQNLIRKHASRYEWMAYGWAGPELSTEYFNDLAIAARKSNKIIINMRRRIAEKNIALHEQGLYLKKLSKIDYQLATLLRQLLESKAKRVDAHSFSYYLAEKMMKEIGSRVGLSLNQMRVIIPKDVAKLFHKVDLSVINHEYLRVLFWFANGKLTKLTGAEADKKLALIYRGIPRIRNSNTIKGEQAYSGLVKGRVRVILDIKDAANFKSGEILVTRMTDPSYLPVMKKATAIITDVGGITCHAAIVSRELRMPCVIGTKIATRVLKTGDRVEVDATTGIVRKL